MILRTDNGLGGRLKAMKAVILAGSMEMAQFPFANHFPKLGLPVANETLLQHMVHHLQVTGITEIAISVADHHALFRALARKINRQPDLGVHVKIFKEDVPMGTAGTLKNLKGFIQGSSVLLLSSSTFISGHDLIGVIEHHRTHGAGLTVVVEKCGPSSAILENFKVDPDGTIREFRVIHESRDRRNPSQCLPRNGKERREHISGAGIYVASPAALAMIPETPGYTDLNEQLIPALDKAGILAEALPLESHLPRNVGLLQYYEANRRILLQPGEDQDFVFRNSRQIADGVWVGEDVEIAASARLVGPVLIGAHCRIGDNAEIIGPVALGRNNHIELGARVEESFLGPSVHVGEAATLTESLVAERGVICKGEKVHRSVVVNAKERKGVLSLTPITGVDGFKMIVRHGRFAPWVHTRRKMYLALKRAIDFSVAASMLVIISPLLALIAAAIKRESSGPIIYSQSRCGKDGQDFKMYKFRTMTENAHELQEQYAAQKDVDGPMFKLENDPRVTRVGRFLRDTSLDELPQLVNVLKSEMSLVGPRPLIMEEMELAPTWRDIRLKAKPGITGLWQVNGRHKISFHDWIKNDIRYVQQQTLALDLKILLSTFKVFRSRKHL